MTQELERKMRSPLIDGNFPQYFLRNLRKYRDLHFLCDCLLRIETRQSIQNVDSDIHTEEIFAHRLVLAVTSNFFKEIFLLKKDQKETVTTVNIKLHSPNAVNCFKVVLGYLYSGELHLRDCDPNHVFEVAKVCQITVLEDYLRPASPPKHLKAPPTKVDNSQLDDKSFTRRVTQNAFCVEHKQLCCPCRNTRVESLASAYTPPTHYSPGPPVSMAYVPVQSNMVTMPTPNAIHLPTVSSTESMRNKIHHGAYSYGYYGALLPTTTNLLPPPANSAPACPLPVQVFPPMMRNALGAPAMSISTPNSPAVPMNEHVTTMEVDREQPTPRETVLKSGANAKLTSMSSPPDAPYDNLGDVIIPSSEKEGWCRNKKYIERVPNGFMCTVCRKVYGRYNSVSYHVTIYHRNPPIKCDEPGCQFTTREGRYIHFHKYYRHHIALPESVDLGVRKCPLCRHVSKSPAMLEKHISRHMPDCKRVGGMYQCPQCLKLLSSQRAMYDHMLTHTEDKNYPCDQCNYKGRTESNLTQHILFKHSSEMFKEKMRCKIDECNFTCATTEAMKEHKTRVHEIEVHSSGPYEIEVMLVESDEDEDKNVDVIQLGHRIETISPISASPLPSFTSVVVVNNNFAIGSTQQQPESSAISRTTTTI